MNTTNSVDEQIAFAAQYQDQEAIHRELASLLEDFVRDQLADKTYDLHVVSARAKSPLSVRQKLLQKRYSDPAKQMTDLIGVRVITYYSEQVDLIADRLREVMTVDDENSLDKREDLINKAQFGYRSVHIVGKLATRMRRDSKYSKLGNHIFEIQVRSVLDHAWAEIEHELVYKSGAIYPVEYQRRFAAVAGAFEILEREFVSLKSAADELVDDYVTDYKAGRGKSKQFDGALLSAALEVQRPYGRSWRQASRAGASFPPITTVLSALKVVGITSWSDLTAALRRQGIRGKLDAFASLAATTPDEISHLAVCAVVLGVKNLDVLKLYLPDVVETQEFLDLFGLREVARP